MIGLKPWDKLPENMRNDAVKEYYDILSRKTCSLLLKRIFDFVVAAVLLLLLSPVFLALAVWIKVDSKGPVFFRQERITQYGRVFHIFKFRTMVNHADKMGSQVTVGNDARITKVGAKIRKVRLDEIPQLINVLTGEMSFVGTRPEVRKYVEAYTDEMYATLLLPAGITSEASICYKDEDELLAEAEDVDKVYIEQVLPDKMKYNLRSMKKFTMINELKVMFRTVNAVLGE